MINMRFSALSSVSCSLFLSFAPALAQAQQAAVTLVLQRIVELGDKKHTVVPEDLRFIIADVLKTPPEHMLRVVSYRVTVETGELPWAEVCVAFQGEEAKADGTGDGGYDAFMTALRKAVKGFDIDWMVNSTSCMS